MLYPSVVQGPSSSVNTEGWGNKPFVDDKEEESTNDNNDIKLKRSIFLKGWDDVVVVVREPSNSESEDD